jgi:DNA-binding transcriptional ArsR family regulator
MLPVSSASPAPTVYPLRAKFFRGLADPSRLAIMESLRPAPQTVGAIVAATGLTQSNVSNHLSCLFECGLVSRERRGKFMVYGLADGRVESLLALADAVIGDLADALGACVRYDASERRQ